MWRNLEVAQLQGEMAVQVDLVAHIKFGRLVDDGLNFNIAGNSINQYRRIHIPRTPTGYIGSVAYCLGTVWFPSYAVIFRANNPYRLAVSYRISKVHYITSDFLPPGSGPQTKIVEILVVPAKLPQHHAWYSRASSIINAPDTHFYFRLTTAPHRIGNTLLIQLGITCRTQAARVNSSIVNDRAGECKTATGWSDRAFYTYIGSLDSQARNDEA
ncbi:hypothetical protein SAMN05660912_02945 [Pseudomonas sp. LAMO17WK12:I1]|nr:hypothetical protein C8K58_102285 [Pseudomonas sp. GV047]SMF35118.1 hypothetical protein SAMN05660912_02945 [Pseudomonas sp. LAMO17WK12:I1]